MIAGYDGYICDECVELSMEIVSEDTEQVKDKGENKDDK
jgi:ATP-dependent protease Clp ATPase subunit